MSESYFFALSPLHLKVEHSFAKTIKPNTKYRLVLYKGIQKCDEMREGVKSKLIGGKIDLKSPQLSFNVPSYNPTRHIQFTVKLCEEKPNEQQVQIGSYVIMSQEYIKAYKNDKQTFFPIEAQLRADLSLGFQLFVEKSKLSLSNAMKNVASSGPKANKQVPEQIQSQSSRSRQSVIQGDGLVSPRKRLQRKRGDQGRLRQRNSSKQKSQRSANGSAATSKRQQRKSSPLKVGQSFTYSPKKHSPSEAAQGQEHKSIPKSQVSPKSIGRQSQSKSNVEVNQKAYKYQPENRSNYTQTKKAVDVERESSPPKSQVIQKAKLILKTPTSRSNITSPQTLLAEVTSRSIVNQPMEPSNNSKIISGAGELQFEHVPQVSKVVQNRIIATSPKQQPQQQLTTTRNQKSLESKLGTQVQTPLNIRQSDIRIQMQGQVTSPTAQLIVHDLVTKTKPVKNQRNQLQQSSVLKGSSRLSQVVHQKQHQQQAKNTERIAQQRKIKILYIAFLIVSAFLIYNAMMPTRRG